MATTKYVVFAEVGMGPEPDEIGYEIEREIEASNAEQACRRAAEQMDAGVLAEGVTLIAVPARNWRTGRHTLKAETTRRIRST